MGKGAKFLLGAALGAAAAALLTPMTGSVARTELKKVVKARLKKTKTKK